MGELKTMMKCWWRVRFPQEAFQAERPWRNFRDAMFGDVFSAAALQTAGTHAFLNISI
jgi:hypothetical protein